MDQKHRASIQALQWQDARDDVIKVNPQLASIIDELDPDKKFLLFKAKYPFGSHITHNGKIYFPCTDGSIQPLDSPQASPTVINHLTTDSLPVTLIINNCAEMFYELPDRLVSWHPLQPGNFCGLWQRFDEAETDLFKWEWSIAAGARSIYLLPKITDTQGHKELRKKYKITSHAPKDYTQHWKIFSEISNSQSFTQEWHCEVLFFSNEWFKMHKNRSWDKFYYYLLKTAWFESRVLHNKNLFDSSWEKFIYNVMDKNVKPNLYLACIIKQLLLTGAGYYPALTIADDDKFGPISALQKVYLHEYKLKNYAPIFMQPHLFSAQDTFPTYYSLQYPNLLETVPKVRCFPSVLSIMPEIMSLMEIFRDKSLQEWNSKNSMKFFCQYVNCKYFHHQPENWNNIHSTKLIPKHDNKLLQIMSNYKGLAFPDTSNLISGCVSFSSKATLF